MNSLKLVCRMPHSSARWPPYGRPETSRLLKVIHHMLHLRIKMRLGAYASSRQDTDTHTGEGSQELRPPVCYQASGSLTLMRVEAVSTAYDTPLAPLGR